MKQAMKKAAAIVLSGTLLAGGLTAAPMSKSVLEIPSIVASAVSTTKYTSGNATYYYYIENNKAVIANIDMSASTPANSTLTVPSKLGGKEVYKLGTWAFRTNAGKIKTLVLPYSLKYLDDSALKNLVSMTDITVSDGIERVMGPAFGPNTKVKNVKLVKSNGTTSVLNKAAVEQIASGVRVKHTGGNGFKITAGSYGKVELIDALAYSPYAEDLCKAKAQEILQKNTVSGLSELQKLQMFYNYHLTHARYSKLSLYTDNALNNLNQKAIGTFYFNSGVCSGFSDALRCLGSAANMTIRTASNDDHRWNLYCPTGSKVYYRLDSVDNRFNFGYPEGGKLTADDGTVCPLATKFLGSSILNRIENSTKQEFRIELRDQNAQDRIYFNYTTQDKTDASSLTLAQLPQTHYENLYAYSHAYYQARIYQGTKLLKTVDYVLSGNKTVTFKDASGVERHLKITINSDPKNPFNDRTDNKAHFLWELY